MQISAPGAAFVRHHEGFVDHYYLDPVGIGTIGTGFTWISDSFRDWWAKNRPGEAFARGATMTRAEADACLQYLCAREYGAAVNKFLGKVPQHVFDGTVSPVYNLGPGSLKWKWAAAVKRGDYAEAAERLRNTGVTARGRKLAGLVTRRREEAELIAHGDYEIGAGRVHAEPLADGVLVKGERGAPILELQTELAKRSLYTGAIDGIFGFGTEAAVLEFQRAAGLEADGYAGPVTLAALAGEVSAKPTAPLPIPPKTPPAAPAPSTAKTDPKPAPPPKRGFWATLWAIITGNNRS